MNKWTYSIGFVFLLFIISFIASGIIGVFITGPDYLGYGNVAVIPIKGEIMIEGSSGFFSTDVASSSEIVSYIEDAAKNKEIKAIVLEIDSPGGSPVASDEIATAIKRANKTTIAHIREIGASGAYWIASSANIIVANRMSITGSIGVFGSYLDYSGLLNRFNVTYERLVAGKYKDAGIPYRKMTPEEELIFQRSLDRLHTYFIEEVARNRNMSVEKVRNLSTGQWYLGVDAKDLGLVDVLGDKNDVDKILHDKLNETPVYVRYEHKKTFFDRLASAMAEQSFYVGKGIGSSLIEASLKSDQVSVRT